MKASLITFFAFTAVGQTAIANSSGGDNLAPCSVAVESNECKTYIMGFLQGALLTDQAIIDSLIDSPPQRSSFKERALRTRLNSREQPATERAGFCLPEDVELENVVARIVTRLDAQQVNDASAVYAAVKTSYPCA